MSVGRITQRSVAESALRGLQGSLARVQNLQEQLSSGKKVSQPSDDPSASAAAMSFRSRRAADEQFLRNIDQISGRLNVTDTTLVQLSDRVRSVRELMVASRNGGLSAEGRTALATQVSAISADVRDLYNTTYLNRPLFGGTVQGQNALDSSGAYIGDDVEIRARISTDATIRVDTSGTAAAADVLPALLDRIALDISSASGATSADFTEIDAAMSKILVSLGDVGARQSRVESTRTNVDNQRLDLTSRISLHEDIDLPEAIMNLQAQQVGYEAALSAAAKITQTSLLDYLR